VLLLLSKIKFVQYIIRPLSYTYTYVLSIILSYKSDGCANAGASDRRETRVQVQDTLTVLRGAQRIRSVFIDLSDVSGTFDFESTGDFLASVPLCFRQCFATEPT
jgi:hypothetical protein